MKLKHAKNYIVESKEWGWGSIQKAHEILAENLPKNYKNTKTASLHHRHL